MKVEGRGRSAKWVVVTLGADTGSDDSHWLSVDRVDRVVRRRRAAPSGRRLGRRALGLGLDSILVALAAILTCPPRSRFLATNPWIAAALRLLGQRDLAVTGIYAEVGSRQWAFLKRVLKGCSVVALSEIEAAKWVSDGTGRAGAIRYGNSWGHDPAPTRDGNVKVFIGGSSDRSHEEIAKLRGYVKQQGGLDLVIAVGGKSIKTVGPWGSIVEYGEVGPKQFGELLSSCDVVYLPLQERFRAAGHMLLAESLEYGLPVVATPVSGMAEYFDGSHVIKAAEKEAVVAQLKQLGLDGRARRAERHQFWMANFSRGSYTQGVFCCIDQLGED